MPKYEDLQYLKQRIVTLGREAEVMASKGKEIDFDPIPEKVDSIDDSYDDLLDESLLDDITNEIENNSDINNYNNDVLSNDLDSLLTNEETDNVSDFESPNLTEDLDDLLGQNENEAESDDLGGLDDLLGQNENEAGSDDFGGLDDLLGQNENEAGSDDLGGLDDLLGQNENEAGSDDFGGLDDLLGQNENEAGSDDFGGLDDLLGQNENEAGSDDLDGLDDLLGQNENEAGSDDFGGLDDLLGQNENEAGSDDFGGLDDLLGQNENEAGSDDFGGLDDLLGQNENEAGSDDFGGLDDLLGQNENEAESDDFGGLDDLLGQNENNAGLDDLLSINDENSNDSSDLNNVNDLESLLGDFNLNESNDDISNLVDDNLDLDSTDEMSETSDMLSDFSLTDMNAISDDEPILDLSSLDNLIDEPDDLDETENVGDLEEFNQDISNIINEEELQEVEQEVYEEKTTENDSNENTPNFNDEQRKNAILSLSTFPKEAELKLAKAIVSDKYSDADKLPLVYSLINHENQKTIAKLYENLTGDSSLDNIHTRKYTGEDFENKQKSFLYNFEKNILPTLSRIASILVIFMLLATFYYFVAEPTMFASKYYKLGRTNIEKKLFNDVETNFQTAWQRQPRYGEIIAYARKYREYARNLDAEKKYAFAVEYKQNDKTDLEFADFYREINKYEKSISIYKNFIDRHSNNVNARVGMGKTYFDWGEVDKEKLDIAEEKFLDALDIDGKNFTALNYLLLTYIRKDDSNLVFKTKAYMDMVYSDKADPRVYSKLASYMIDKNMLNEAKGVLDQASASLKADNIIPELDYEFARYHKALNISDIERFYLENAVKKAESINKKNIQANYPGNSFNHLKAKIYNDLGENYFRQSKINLKAEEMFNRAISTDPDYGKPYFNLGTFAYATKGNREEALYNYEESEKRGYKDETLDYNLGWLYYRADRFYESYKKINSLLDRHPDNDNLKFMLGTTLYKINKYDLAESTLYETYDRFITLKQSQSPMDMDIKEHRNIVEMIYRTSNNLGSTFEKKYEQTRKSSYLIQAHNYYAISIENYDRYTDKRDTENYEIENETGLKRKNIRTAPHLNLKMSLYPSTPVKDDPIIYDDFNPMEFMK